MVVAIAMHEKVPIGSLRFRFGIFACATLLVLSCKNPSRGRDGKRIDAGPTDGAALTSDGEAWFCKARCLSGSPDAGETEVLMEQHANPEVAYATLAKACIDRDGRLVVTRSEDATLFSPALVGDVCERTGKDQTQVCAAMCQSKFQGGQNAYRFVRSNSRFSALRSIDKICVESEAMLIADSISCLPATAASWTCTFPCRGGGEEEAWRRVFVRSGPSVEAVFGQLMADCALDSGSLDLGGLPVGSPYRIDSLCVAN